VAEVNGNLTSDGTTSYTYDLENQLVSASGPTARAIWYDPLGRLSRTLTSSVDERFLHDGGQLALEYDGSSAAFPITRRYVFGPDLDEPVVEDAGGALNCSGKRFLNADRLGSVIARSDCSGNRTDVETYDESGAPGPLNQGRFGYTGQMWMPEIGKYYYKARMYSPALGRFLQTDPVGPEDGPNLYAYVENDPVNLTDALGLQANDPPIVICGNCGRLGGTPAFGTLPVFVRSFAAALPRTFDLKLPQFLLPTSPAKQCSDPNVSPGERKALASGDVTAFWKSRQARGDPFASTALSVIQNRGIYGAIANGKLAGALRAEYPLASTSSIQQAIGQISLAIAQAHATSVSRFGSANAAQIAAYHYQVFSRYHLPARTFGGGRSASISIGSNAVLNWAGCR
jgi:RHS repeat-associated protein